MDSAEGKKCLLIKEVLQRSGAVELATGANRNIYSLVMRTF